MVYLGNIFMFCAMFMFIFRSSYWVCSNVPPIDGTMGISKRTNRRIRRSQSPWSFSKPKRLGLSCTFSSISIRLHQFKVQTLYVLPDCMYYLILTKDNSKNSTSNCQIDFNKFILLEKLIIISLDENGETTFYSSSSGMSPVQCNYDGEFRFCSKIWPNTGVVISSFRWFGIWE